MSFRNIKVHIPIEDDCASLVRLHGTDFKVENLNVPLPASSDYSLKDMLAAGVKVQPVDPTVVHDSSATSVVVDALVNQPATTLTDSNVEPSNID